MKHLLAPHPNFFLIPSLESDVKLQSLNTSVVASGDSRLLKRAIEAVSSKILVYTRLDADDGLARLTLRRVQSMAIDQLKNFTPTNNDKTLSKGWIAYCISRHFEWHPSPRRSTKANAGHLIYLLEKHCVTPGLTYAFAPGMGLGDLPTTKHHVLHYEMPPCRMGKDTSACLNKLTNVKTPMAIRPRTATSAGMLGVGDNVDSNVTSLPVFWEILQSQFNIERHSLVNLQKYMNKNVRAIARDNLKGQCTKGHSCKETSKHLLKRLSRHQKSKKARRKRVAVR